MIFFNQLWVRKRKSTVHIPLRQHHLDIRQTTTTILLSIQDQMFALDHQITIITAVKEVIENIWEVLRAMSDFITLAKR